MNKELINEVGYGKPYFKTEDKDVDFVDTIKKTVKAFPLTLISLVVFLFTAVFFWTETSIFWNSVTFIILGVTTFCCLCSDFSVYRKSKL